MIYVSRTIRESTLIPHPPQAVWELLADFGGVAKWASRMKSSRITEGERNVGIGTRRVMRHIWGFCIEETVTSWQEGSGFTFRLDRAPMPLRDVQETWAIEQAEAGTLVRTEVSYRTGWARLGTLLDHLLLRFLIAREMRHSLRCLRHFADYRFRPIAGRA